MVVLKHLRRSRATLRVRDCSFLHCHSLHSLNDIMANATVTATAQPFIDTFCAVQSYSELGTTQARGISFSLEKFSPCFNDVIVIGGADLLVLFLGILRLYYLWTPRIAKYAMKPAVRAVQKVKIFFAFLASLVSLVQLSGRIGASQVDLAPFEYLSFGLGLAAFSFLCVLYLNELKATDMRGGAILNFVVLLELAGHTVKLYYLVELNSQTGRNTTTSYFTGVFYLKYASVALLVLLSLFYVPGDKDFIRLGQPEEMSEETILESIDKDGFTTSTCPEKEVGCFSRLTFNWMGPLMTLGHKRPLEREDVWMLPAAESSKTLNNAFQAAWGEEAKLEKPSLLRALRRTYLKQFILAGLFKVFNDAAQFVGPVFIGSFIQFVASQKSANPVPQSMGYVYAVCIFVGTLVGAMAENQYFQTIMRTGLYIRSVLISSIFRVALMLSAKGRHGRSAGKMVNLMSSDSEGLQSAVQGLWNAWSAPVRIIVSLVLLFGQLSWATLFGVLMLALAIPLQKRFVAKSLVIFRQSSKTTDERLKYENELLGAMQVVKFYAWENSFENRIGNVRTKELDLLWRAKRLQMINSFFINSVPIFVTVVTFAVYALFIGDLTAEKAFTSIAYFNILRYPLYQLPAVINQIVNAQVMLGRIQEFLLADVLENQADELPQAAGEISPAPPIISIQDNAKFAWNIDQRDASLSEAGFQAEKGELVAVIGGTGQGKSTLLNALLGEMPCISGPINAASISGSIAYVPQESWVFNASLKENILFGLPYDEARYNNAIRCARMIHDLELMDAGDATEIGEKGVNLSGGQRQRLSIARAVYADADVYLFDDPLSALDAKVAREVYDMCIRGHLKGKTIVLVTNRVEFVAGADKILLMSDQKILCQGKYDELIASSKAFKSIMHTVADANEEEEGAGLGAKEDSKDSVKKLEVLNGEKQASAQKKNQSVAQLIKKETRSRGSVPWSTIKWYIESVGGNCTVVLLLLSYFLAESFRLAGSYWLKFWSSDAFGLKGSGSYLSVYLGLYAAFSLSQSLVGLATSYNMDKAGLKGSRTLHDGMLSALLRAPMSFYNANPHGRIINRFTKDVSDIDKMMIMFTGMVLRAIVQLLGTLFIIGMQTPYTLVSFVPVMLVFYYVQRFFQDTSRELKRLDATTRSPIYAHFSECLNGIACIRAYNKLDSVNNELGKKLNSHLRMNLAQFSANRWLSVRLEFLGGSLVLFASLFVVIGYRQIDAAGAGMQLSFALQITGLLNMLVRVFSLAENSFNAVERIKEYSDAEQEKPAVEAHDEHLGPSSWPLQGKIEYKEVFARYRSDLKPVLKGLTFDIQPGEKVGLVGRTGAGKSSLFLTLFRIVERDEGQGSITIDGYDIAAVGLKRLRDSISIIPQEPVLFVGTLRFNLDPFEKHTDVEIWEALESAHMKATVQDSQQGLDMLVEENGSNFSVGQRQLICLARALLKQSKILVLDEATAAVDVETDHLIQATIRKSFSTCSTLTIAHRLDTIIDSDRVLVLDSGVALEFDTPRELLNNPKYSAFASMVKETGRETEKYLRSIAMGEVSYAKNVEEKIQSSQKRNSDTLRRSLSGLELIVDDRDLSMMSRVQNALVVIRDVMTPEGKAALRAELHGASSNYDESAWFEMLLRNVSKLHAVVGEALLEDYGETEEDIMKHHGIKENDLFNSTHTIA